MKIVLTVLVLVLFVGCNDKTNTDTTAKTSDPVSAPAKTADPVPTVTATLVPTSTGIIATIPTPEPSATSTPAASQSSCPFVLMTKNGDSYSDPLRTEYRCTFPNLPNNYEEHDFAFFKDSSGYHDNHSAPFANTTYSVDKDTCKLTIAFNGVNKIILSNPRLDGSDHLASFDHYQIFAGSKDYLECSYYTTVRN